MPAPFVLDQGQLKYAPLGHPEIPLASGRLASGRLLVSTSRNTTDLGTLQGPAQVGRPLFAEVQVPAD